MRPYCSVCRYPQKTCVCSAVTQICTPVQFLIIQHEKEAIHAKNTAKLVQLCLPDTPILSAGADEAEMAVADALNNAGSPAVIYPSPESTSLEKTPRSGTHDLFILLDGSWRQAYGLWQRFTQLHPLPQYHFSHAGPSDYRIRHTRSESGLSTLEAVAHVMKVTTETDPAPLYRLQQFMQAQWQGPAAHLRRK